jgi:hypothetical protein
MYIWNQKYTQKGTNRDRKPGKETRVEMLRRRERFLEE